MSDGNNQQINSNGGSSDPSVSLESSSSVVDKALAVVAVGAVLAISYVVYRQRADHNDILQLIEQREKRRE